jgi:Asp-tRNA(Asn)/Glu-tRNA(Gln) amidotransferase A subunit family amidase
MFPFASEPPSRRQVLAVLSSLGIGSTVFQRALAAKAAEEGTVTPEMIQQAEWIAGLELKEAERKSAARALQRAMKDLKAARALPIDHGVPPALVFRPLADSPGHETARNGVSLPDGPAPARPADADTLAFMPVRALAGLLRSRQVSSVELTKLYLQRLRKYDPALLCVVTLTEDLALAQAERMDKEIAAGRYRGPLHGISWGAKDLMAVPGYTTTWGAGHYREQKLADKATVVRRLEDAGAVLVAKMSLGALASGDRWFKGRTRNPWDVRHGSSGSSAGSAAAVAAGLVGFALGSETLGSIVSPCERCGVSGLRPTFGRVSRHGCMTLSWSMDKIGPIARSLEDCALIFAAIQGADGLDPSTVDRPFCWPLRRDLRSLRVGYIENDKSECERDELRVLGDLGVRLVPIKLPGRFPLGAMRLILRVEAGAVFDELTRKGVSEGLGDWPDIFRAVQFIPAVEYLRANRARTLLMREMEEVMSQIDAYVGGDDLVITNLTGHPTVVMPSGFKKQDGVEVPQGLTFTGRLHGEAELLALGHAYQQATGFHLRRPPLDRIKAPDTPKR